jgi:hypothetical protein
VYCQTDDVAPILRNNIVAFSTHGGGLYVLVNPVQPVYPVVTYCDFYSNTGGNYVNYYVSKPMPDPTGKNGNISVDPLFAAAASGDYHLKSQGGRWNGSAWVVDSVSSPCIDAGDPASAFNLEPAPNGDRINMGYDGNTAYASKTASANPLPTVTANGPTGTTVGVTASINILFSVAMSRPSVQTNLLINGVKAATLSGTFTWLGRKITFKPTHGWQPGTVYKVIIAKTARDRTGLTMGKSFVWTFTTKPAAASALTVAALPTAGGAQITLNLAAAADVTVSIRNLAGREIAVLTPRQLEAGVQSLLWNGRSTTGTRVPAGQYLLNVTARGKDGSQSQALAGLSLGR